MERLNKKLVEVGYCSRRKADKLISEGRVIVNNEMAKLGQLVDDKDEVIINGSRIDLKVDKKIIIAYNKPKGVICTESDIEKNTKISDKIKQFGIDKRLFTVGRLDKDTSGLIIITNDGDLCRQITNAKNQYEKEYEVRVNKPIDDNFVKQMENGVYLEDLDRTTSKAKIKKFGKEEYRFTITIKEGLNRQIRRMCIALGYRVVILKRIRIIKLKLGELKVGEFKYITKKDLGIRDDRK